MNTQDNVEDAGCYVIAGIVIMAIIVWIVLVVTTGIDITK